MERASDVQPSAPAVDFPGVSALWPETDRLRRCPVAEEAPPTRAIEPKDAGRPRIVEPERTVERNAERTGETSQPAVVLSLARNPMRTEAPPPLAGQALSGLDRLLRLAAARGASTLYLSSGARPSIRVDGEVQALESTPVLGPNDVESLLLTLMPERNAEALRTGTTSEWICDFPDLGRVRCMSFRDHRGPGGVFRIMPIRAVTSQQLGLSREIQELAAEPEGLVLVAGSAFERQTHADVGAGGSDQSDASRARHHDRARDQRGARAGLVVYQPAGSARRRGRDARCRPRRVARRSRRPRARERAKRRADESGARCRGIGAPGDLRLPGA